jgi:hypothetical protein
MRIDANTQGMLDLMLCLQVAGRPLSTEDLIRMQPRHVRAVEVQQRLEELMGRGQVHCHIVPGSGRVMWVSGPGGSRQRYTRMQAIVAARAAKAREQSPLVKKHRHVLRMDRPDPEFSPRRDPIVAAFFGPA